MKENYTFGSVENKPDLYHSEMSLEQLLALREALEQHHQRTTDATEAVLVDISRVEHAIEERLTHE